MLGNTIDPYVQPAAVDVSVLKVVQHDNLRRLLAREGTQHERLHLLPSIWGEVLALYKLSLALFSIMAHCFLVEDGDE